MRRGFLLGLAAIAVVLCGCASAPTFELRQRIPLALTEAAAPVRVTYAGKDRNLSERTESAGGIYAKLLGDNNFVPELSKALPSYIDRAFNSWPSKTLVVRAVNVGAYRVVERSPRIAGDPLTLMLGVPIGASVVGNVLGSALTDRLLTDELVNQEYWAVGIAIEVDRNLLTATNRRRKEPGDDVSSVLPQMIQFTADDLALKYRLSQAQK